jgi:hypothetical protein
MTTVVLGNRNAVHSPDNGETVLKLKGKHATQVIPGPDDSLAEIFKAVTDPTGVWASHATPGAAPPWVASEDPDLTRLLAAHFGGAEVRDLETGDGPGGLVAATALTTLALGLMLARCTPWLKTNIGNDFQAAQMSGAAVAAPAVAKWVALTANATAPGPTDTTLTAEIVTASGGLIRKIGTYAHTTGAASYTLTTVFTVNGSDSIPVTIAKRGIFDAASAGNMVFETLVSPTATLSAVGDALTLTDTITM